MTFFLHSGVSQDILVAQAVKGVHSSSQGGAPLPLQAVKDLLIKLIGDLDDVWIGDKRRSILAAESRRTIQLLLCSPQFVRGGEERKQRSLWRRGAYFKRPNKRFDCSRNRNELLVLVVERKVENCGCDGNVQVSHVLNNRSQVVSGIAFSPLIFLSHFPSYRLQFLRALFGIGPSSSRGYLALSTPATHTLKPKSKKRGSEMTLQDCYVRPHFCNLHTTVDLVS
nr:hypothetical protein Iba_chr08fCG1720 [Ipomoea batatas]